MKTHMGQRILPLLARQGVKRWVVTFLDTACFVVESHLVKCTITRQTVFNQWLCQ
jgi:hypothetical protein